IARQRFNEKNGKPAAGYDPEIGKAFSAAGDGEVPPLWRQFGALKHAPCLVIRGALSDLLSERTVNDMKERHPNCRAHTVPRQGHAPTLTDRPTEHVIRGFLEEHDTAGPH
ncbi:MAG: alpha/beta hydrolase, partial [Alphaproteobacteria bacterium]|nr:alpha/beta hydrolase [Alphaproteobacteria bacterium]